MLVCQQTGVPPSKACLGLQARACRYTVHQASMTWRYGHIHLQWTHLPYTSAFPAAQMSVACELTSPAMLQSFAEAGMSVQILFELVRFA